ncbi:MAG: TIGR02186 family protein [Alphaproteobacteria bacterium]|nr:TIGR02186 family protein [Alphaproteobacteria bacterium]
MLRLLAITRAVFAAVAFASLMNVGASRAQPVIADVSEHFVGITADFTGAKILFFGTTTGPGKLVVVIRGPAQDIDVGAKIQRAGIWMNGESVTFKDAPSFYRVLSTEPLGEWLPLDVREANRSASNI